MWRYPLFDSVVQGLGRKRRRLWRNQNLQCEGSLSGSLLCSAQVVLGWSVGLQLSLTDLQKRCSDVADNLCFGSAPSSKLDTRIPKILTSLSKPRPARHLHEIGTDCTSARNASGRSSWFWLCTTPSKKKKSKLPKRDEASKHLRYRQQMELLRQFSTTEPEPVRRALHVNLQPKTCHAS